MYWKKKWKADRIVYTGWLKQTTSWTVPILLSVLSLRHIRSINIYLVISLLLHLALDSFLGLQDTLDRHVRMQATSALHLALIPFLGTLTFLLNRLSLHSHRETFLVSAILTSISLPFVNDAGFLFATRVRQILAHGPLKESFATLAAAKEIIFSSEY